MPTSLTYACASLLLAARPDADAVAAEDRSDPWLLVGMVAQALITVTFVWQWWESNRRGRFWLPPFAAALALLATAAVLVYALQRSDPVFIFGEAVYLLIALRMYYLAVQFKRRVENAQWPGFPRVSPEVAEQRHVESSATLSGEIDTDRK